MTYTPDRELQLKEATLKSRFGSVASLKAKGVGEKPKTAKKTAKKAEATPTKKAAAAKPAAKTTTTKKTPAKKAAKKS